MKKRDQDVLLQVEYVPLPVEREVSWRAGISLLLQILKKAVWFLYPEAEDESMGIDSDGDLDGSVAALLGSSRKNRALPRIPAFAGVGVGGGEKAY
jgi:hypothetical protein